MNEAVAKLQSPSQALVPVTPSSDLANQIQRLVDENAHLHMEVAQLRREADHMSGQITELRLKNSELAMDATTSREAVIQAEAAVHQCFEVINQAKAVMPATGLLDNIEPDLDKIARFAHKAEDDGPLTGESKG